MAGRTYIALNGPSEWATFNAMWAVLKQHDYVPDSIIIATFKEDSGRASRTSDRPARGTEDGPRGWDRQKNVVR